MTILVCELYLKKINAGGQAGKTQKTVLSPPPSHGHVHIARHKENLPTGGVLGRQPRTAGFCQASEGEEWPEPSNMLGRCRVSAWGSLWTSPPVSSPLPGPRAGPPPHLQPQVWLLTAELVWVGRELWSKRSARLVGPSGPASGGKGSPHWSVGQGQGCVASSGHSSPWASPTFPVPWPRTSLSPPPCPVDATGNPFGGSLCATLTPCL